MTTWEADQIDKRLRKRSELLAKGTLVNQLPRELTIEGIAEHYQKSMTEIMGRIKQGRTRDDQPR